MSSPLLARSVVADHGRGSRRAKTTGQLYDDRQAITSGVRDSNNRVIVPTKNFFSIKLASHCDHRWNRSETVPPPAVPHPFRHGRKLGGGWELVAATLGAVAPIRIFSGGPLLFRLHVVHSDGAVHPPPSPRPRRPIPATERDALPEHPCPAQGECECVRSSGNTNSRSAADRLG